jgi:putative ABC transport system permease protein
MSVFLRDARLALRTMWKRKATTALLVTTLGLGLGSNIAMFSMADVLLLRPLNLPNDDRLVRLWSTSPTSEMFDRSSASPADLLDWKQQSGDVFESLVALEDWDATLRGSGVSERVPAQRVSPEFFEALGVRPVLGRGFLKEEGEAGSGSRVVLSHAAWQRIFDKDPQIVGREVLVDGKSSTVVGIAPRGFAFPEGAEVWMPLPLPTSAAAPRDQRHLSAVGLLKEGRSLSDARNLMEVVARRLETEHPATNKAWRVRIETISRGFEDPALRNLMGFFLAGTGLVLLIACVNLANFLLAQGAERRREVALRQALGATRGRIVSQMLTEGLITALLSLAVALPVAGFSARAVREFMPLELIRYVAGWGNIGIDSRAVFFGGILAVLATAIFALAPARVASSPALVESLKEGGRAASAGGHRQRGRDMLVTSQIATALAIVIVGSLATRSAWQFVDGPQGYNPDNALSLRVSLPEAAYQTPGSRVAFARAAMERMEALPGVVSVATTNILPARGSNSSRSIRIEGAPPVEPSERPSADSRTVTPAFFKTLEIPIVAGRGFDDRDTATETATQVAIVSGSFAERYWPGLDPLGRRFQAGDDALAPLLTVVGVSGDVIHQWFARRNYPTYYRPYAQDPRASIAFVLKTTAAEPESLARDVRQAMAEVDPDQPAYDVWSMRRSLLIGTVGIRFVAATMAALSALALILALSGVYGVMAYRVSLRTLEIGIRRALGASKGDVLRLTMDQALRLTTLGLVLGGGLGLAMVKALGGLLQGAVALDSATVGASAALLATAALLAAYIPARRSLTVEPTRALRAE